MAADKEKKDLEFLGFPAAEQSDGYKVGVECYRKYMKEEHNVDPKVLDAVNKGNQEILKKGLEWAGEQVVEKGDKCKITVSTGTGMSLFAQVTERTENKGGIQPADGETEKFGACRVGMKIKLDNEFFRPTKDKIEADCRAAYAKRNK